MKKKHKNLTHRVLSGTPSRITARPSRRLITPTTSPEKLGGFRRKTGKETTFAPYFFPGISKFHGNLSLASGKLPSPVARSPPP